MLAIPFKKPLENKDALKYKHGDKGTIPADKRYIYRCFGDLN